MNIRVDYHDLNTNLQHEQELKYHQHQKEQWYQGIGVQKIQRQETFYITYC